jgi:hypothetical protein
MKKMKKMKVIQTSSLILMALFFLVVGCKEDEEPQPVVPDYSTYYFEDFLTVDSVELTNADGYSFDMVLKRTTSTQADDITVELTDASGVFGFSDGATSMVLSFAANETSKNITVKPVDASDVSAFLTYDLSVKMVVPAGTPAQGEFSKAVKASVAANYQPVADGNIAYGWGFAAVVYGADAKDFELEKDSNVDLYKCKSIYADDYDIYFGVDNGNVVIEDMQIMMITDPAIFGAAVELAMEITSSVYDAGAKTVTITYDMVRTDGGTFVGVPMTDVVDVYTLP